MRKVQSQRHICTVPNPEDKKSVKVHSKEILDKIKINSIQIQQGKWRQFNLKDFCKTIYEWKVEDKMCLRNNDEPEIINHIIEIRFPYLTKLLLQDNKIQSIQNLSRIYLPLIESMGFQRNLLVSAKPVRKFHFPKFIEIGFGGNFMKNEAYLLESWAPQLSGLGLEMKYEYRQLTSDINWSFKLQSNQLVLFYCRAVQRIKLPIKRLIEKGMIERKFINLNPKIMAKIEQE